MAQPLLIDVELRDAGAHRRTVEGAARRACGIPRAPKQALRNIAARISAFLDIAPDIGHFGYLNRFASRPLVLRGYRTALRALAHAKERGVFDGSPADLVLN